MGCPSRFLFFFIKIIYSNANVLLYLSKTTRQHHRERKKNDYPKSKNIKTSNIKIGYPPMPRWNENVPARRDRMKISWKCLGKTRQDENPMWTQNENYVSIDSQGISTKLGIPPSWEIPARRGHVNIPWPLVFHFIASYGFLVPLTTAVYIEDFRQQVKTARSKRSKFENCMYGCIL